MSALGRISVGPRPERGRRAPRIAAGVAAPLAIAALAGCMADPAPPARPTPGHRVKVRSFTDVTPVRQVVAAPPYAFTATSAGLDRWDLGNAERLHLTGEHGLPGDDIRALALDTGRRWLWIATDGGLTRYAIDAGTFTSVTPPPVTGGIDLAADDLLLAAAGDGGAWLGGRFGLARVSEDGTWSQTGIDREVTALARDRHDVLWIGTQDGILARSPAGEIVDLDEPGCRVGAVRILLPAPRGGALAVGDTTEGRQRIALAESGGCRRFRSSPNVRWIDADAAGSSVAVLTRRGLYAMTGRSGGARRLRRNGMRLLALGGGARPVASGYRLRSIDVDVPIGARSVALADEEILIGTDQLGTARVSAQRGRQLRWLRRRSLTAEASSLHVACAAPDDCFLATGARRLWRFDGSRFTAATGGEHKILAVVRRPGGGIYAIRRPADGDRIEFAERVESGWRAVDRPEVTTPGARPQLSFARFSPSGMLWLGLRYRDEVGELRPYGVALVDLDLGVVAYHHASADDAEADRGVLPIPISAMDVSFVDDQVWLATQRGAAAVRDGEVRVYSEADGLRSELLRGVAAGRGGSVFVASRAGVGVFDGRGWDYPSALRYTVNDLDFSGGGKLWMATDRGLAAYDGARVRRLDARRGLLENRIRDLAIDGHGRVWVRGSEGLTLVAP